MLACAGIVFVYLAWGLMPSMWLNRAVSDPLFLVAILAAPGALSKARPAAV